MRRNNRHLTTSVAEPCRILHPRVASLGKQTRDLSAGIVREGRRDINEDLNTVLDSYRRMGL